MCTLRGHLRVCAASWLVLQAATLLALVPLACCEAHTQTRAEKPACHERPAAARCPMRAADGQACPMHRDEPSSRDADAGCVMRGTCKGPMAALVTTLSTTGILPDAVPLDPSLLLSTEVGDWRGRPILRVSRPESPPPRV